MTEFNGFAAGNPGRGLAGDPPPAPSSLEIDPATGRPPGISAFGAQRVRVPGASLSDLPDAPAPGRGGFPAAPEESGPASGGFPLRGGGGAFPTRRGDSGGFPLRSSVGPDGDSPAGDLPIRSQQSPFSPPTLSGGAPSPFGSPTEDALPPYARAATPEQPPADPPFGRVSLGEATPGPFARPVDDQPGQPPAAGPSSFGTARPAPASFGSASVGSGGDSPFGADQPDSPFGAAAGPSPFGRAPAGGPPQLGGDFDGAEPGSGSPYGSTPPGNDSPFGNARPGDDPRFGAQPGSGSPYGPARTDAPLGRRDSDSPYGQARPDASFGRPESDSPYGQARSDAPFGQPEGVPSVEQPRADSPFGQARGDAGQSRPEAPFGQPDSDAPFAQPGGDSPYDSAPPFPSAPPPSSGAAFGSARPGSGSTYGTAQPGSPYDGAQPASGSPDGGLENGSPFRDPESSSPYGAPASGPAFGGTDEGSRFGSPDGGPRFGGPEQSDDHAIYRRPESLSGDSPSSGSGYPRRVPGAALGAVGLPDAAPGSPSGFPGSPSGLPGSPSNLAGDPSNLPGSPSALPGAASAFPGSPGAGADPGPGPFSAASPGDSRNGAVPQPRDPAERSAPAVGSARPVTASASVPSASRVAPVDPSELPPPPAAPQARVYGRPAAEPAPADDESTTPEPEQPSNSESPFRPPTPFGPRPFGDRPDDDRRAAGAFGSPAFPPPLALPGGSPAFPGTPGPGNDQYGPSGISAPPYPGQPGSDQNGPPGFGSPAYPGRPDDADAARASARASASARVAPPGPQPISPDRPGTPPFGEPTSDVAGRGRAPEQYTEHTTDIAGRGEPYVPAPALPTFPPAGQPVGDRQPMGGLFPGPSNRATVTPPTPEETTSWPGIEASDQNRFDQFKPDTEPAAAPAKPETPHVRMLPILLAVVVGAALLVGLAFGIVYLVAGGDSGSSNAGFTVNTGDCVKKSGTAAVKADCSAASTFQVVSIVDDKSKCADPQQPYVLNPTSDGKTQVLCLKPNS